MKSVALRISRPYVDSEFAREASQPLKAIDAAVPWRNLLPPAQTYPPGTEFFSQGSPVQEIYLVEKGLIKLVWLDSSGRELIVGLRHSGSFLGLASAIANAPHKVSAITLSQSMLVRIPREQFLSFVDSRPQLASVVQQALSREICDQTDRIAELGCLSSRERVKQMLQEIARVKQNGKSGSNEEVRLSLPLRQFEVASMLAVTPEHLSRVLKQLRQEGIISWRKGWLIVPDVRRLIS